MKFKDVPYPKKSLPYAIASGFYSGTIPVVTRGTMGSICCTLPGFFIWQTGGSALLLLCAFFMFFAGWWGVQTIESALDKKYHDASVFVADEWVGQWMCLSVALPLFWNQFGLLSIVFSLLSFAIFDGLKPWPIRIVDRFVKGGFGVMFDDVCAGAASCGLLYVLYLILPQLGF